MKWDNVSGGTRGMKTDEEEIIKNSSIANGRLSVLNSHLLFLSPSPPLSVSPPAADRLLLQRWPLMASEKEAALSATPPSSQDSPTLFDKIINKEIPAKIVFEDDKVLAFRDIAPQAPTHILIIPKVKDGLTGLSQAEEKHCEILGYLMYAAKLVAKQEGLDDGYRVVINDGPSGCQSVYHIHVHLLGGRQMNWPPG